MGRPDELAALMLGNFVTGRRDAAIPAIIAWTASRCASPLS